MVWLEAVDYTSGALVWDNRATPSVVLGMASGDFAGVGTTATLPLRAQLAGTPAVVFNASAGAGGTAQYLAANASLAGFAGMYGASPWTYESWVLHTGYMTGANTAESPVFQWSPRWVACGVACCDYSCFIFYLCVTLPFTDILLTLRAH